MEVCEFIIGSIVVAVVLFDVFQSVVVPRQTARTLRIAPLLSRNLWRAWRQIGLCIRSLQQREYFLGIFAPLSLILELLVWVVSLICGYGLMLHALHSQLRPITDNFGTALYLAGTSLFTLGSNNVAPTGITRVIVLAAAASGVAVMSLTIALLFSLYSSFQRRETLVVLLDTRAGTPPSGLRLLENYTQLGLTDELPIAFAAWEVWSAEVFESHRAYPILPYFRSNTENTSWLGALGAVLDACTLLLTTVESKESYGTARLMHSTGCRVLQEFNRLFALSAANKVGVEREEFELARVSLARAGFVLRHADEAWISFSQMRAAYSGSLNALARYFAMPMTIPTTKKR
ncbi:MAG: two pore domain potassium channel family protein [Chroococcidiopsidaceae cyanobacterium CP_BM_ER_R8_30]|nr:two pore domain potassium channel family protein [Chroococcidiopsidaceae cyanobacterium CP_BM_ER_R8_30]